MIKVIAINMINLSSNIAEVDIWFKMNHISFDFIEKNIHGGLNLWNQFKLLCLIQYDHLVIARSAVCDFNINVKYHAKIPNILAACCLDVENYAKTLVKNTRQMCSIRHRISVKCFTILKFSSRILHNSYCQKSQNHSLIDPLKQNFITQLKKT